MTLLQFQRTRLHPVWTVSFRCVCALPAHPDLGEVLKMINLGSAVSSWTCHLSFLNLNLLCKMGFTTTTSSALLQQLGTRQ